MAEILIYVCITLTLCVIVIQLIALFRQHRVDVSPLNQNFASIEQSHERSERSIREDMAANRTELADAGQKTRTELHRLLQQVAKILHNDLVKDATNTDAKLGAMRDTIEQRLDVVQRDSGEKLDAIRVESGVAAKKAREEVTVSLKTFCELINKTCEDLGIHQRLQLSNVIEQLCKLTDSTEKKLEAHRTSVDQRLAQMQTDALTSGKQSREELALSLKHLTTLSLRA